MTSNVTALPDDDLERVLVVATPDGSDVKHISLAGGSYTVLVSGAQTAGRYCLIDMLVPPNGGPPPHRHDFEEMFTLLEGELAFSFRGETRVVAAPATVAIPANAPHAFRNTSDHTVHMLCMCTPAGQETYFAAVGVAVASRDAAPPVLSAQEQAEKRALAQSLALQYRTEFLPPPTKTAVAT
jgi:quercetin dioxygenase-like cupin family protein